MSERRTYLDVGVGETRGVVTLDGRPERLLIRRDGDLACQALGAEAVGRVRKVERQLALAFVELGGGPDGVLNLRPDMERLVEGQAVRVEIRSEARAGKGASLRLIGEGEGPPRLVTPAPSIEDELAGVASRAEVVTGGVARATADTAEAEALETVFPLSGGGTVAIAARVLRLKGEGGLVVIDLAGRGHDGPALISGARLAFGPDNPGVAFGPISRFGTLELTVPRRRRSIADRLLDEVGQPTAETLALRLIRQIEREATADPGARIEALAAPDVAAAADAYLQVLTDRYGARLALSADAARSRGDPEMRRL